MGFMGEACLTCSLRVFSASRTLSFVDNTVEQEAKSKQICHDDLIPPLSINLLQQELHALCQVANRIEVISSGMLFYRAVRAF